MPNPGATPGSPAGAAQLRQRRLVGLQALGANQLLEHGRPRPKDPASQLRARWHARGGQLAAHLVEQDLPQVGEEAAGWRTSKSPRRLRARSRVTCTRSSVSPGRAPARAAARGPSAAAVAGSDGTTARAFAIAGAGCVPPVRPWPAVSPGNAGPDGRPCTPPLTAPAPAATAMTVTTLRGAPRRWRPNASQRRKRTGAPAARLDHQGAAAQ